MTPCKGGNVVLLTRRASDNYIRGIAMTKIITAVLAFAIAALASPAHVVATWEHFGADPAYRSREAAIADAPRVLRLAVYPESVISLLTEAMKNPGVETHVTNGMKLDFMRSGKSAFWRNVVVKFKKPPREESMEYSAPSEEWTVELNGTKWTVGIPKVCNNTYGKRSSAPTSTQKPSAAPPAPAKPRFIIGVCPNVYTLEVKVHENRAFYLPGVEQTHAQEERGVVFVGKQHVSRTHGPQLRKSLADGGHQHSKTPQDFRVSLIMTPEIRTGVADITDEQFVADITVIGSREIDFSLAEIDKWDAIRVVAVKGEEVRSPPRFAGTGLHEMRFFNKLSGTEHGEWDNPVQRECFKTEHWIEQPVVPKQNQ